MVWRKFKFGGEWEREKGSETRKTKAYGSKHGRLSVESSM